MLLANFSQLINRVLVTNIIKSSIQTDFRIFSTMPPKKRGGITKVAEEKKITVEPKRKRGRIEKKVIVTEVESESESVSESESEFEPESELTPEPVPREPKVLRSTAKKDAKKDEGSALINPTVTSYDNFNVDCVRKNSLGEIYNFKVSTWNVDGLRAWVKKDGLKFIDKEQPDILCLQETKCAENKLPQDVTSIEGYHKYWATSTKDGYAGVALFSKRQPKSVQYGIGVKKFDADGRCIVAEYDNFYVISVYVPNAGRKLVTLPKRLEWNKEFRSFINELDKKKPVIVCGDLNVAHREIDLANPKTNTKNAGFTKEERQGLTEFLGDGYVDTFREFYPDKAAVYTFWSYMMKCRSKNVGWRLDYFLVSERYLDKVCDNVIRDQVLGSDHCPLTLFLKV